MKHDFTAFFPYGCQYHRAPTPLPSEWESDLAEIARNGYTHVQFRPQWRWHERIQGQPVWDDLDRLFDLAAQNRLRVILKPQLENAPDWVFTELGGTRVGFHGKRLDPIAHAAFYVGGWWPCYDNPAVAAAATEFTRMIAARYKDHEALWFYNAWNEPRSRPLGQCMCEHSVKKYQDYLRREFGTVEALNEAYGKAWSSFETVFPPHSFSDYTELFLWRRWAAEAVAEQVALSVKGIRLGDPGAKIMCHVGCSGVVQDPACDTSDDILNAKEVDWYGCSFPIELFPRTLIDRNMPLFQSSWLRRIDSNYWCQEFYTNYSNWCREADPDFIEQAIWMAVASGCRGLTFWQYRSERFGEESNGWGMREIDGSPTRRSESCDRVARELVRLGSDFAASSPVRSPVAIWFDVRNDLLMRIEEMHCDLSEIESVRGKTDYSYKNAVAGAHMLLRKLGYTADFVTRGDDLSGYRLLVVSSVELVEEAAAEWLTAFVENGGTLLVEYPFACRDSRTWVTPQRPSNHLERLTGCRETVRTVFSETVNPTVYFEKELKQPADGWRVVLTPVDAEVKVIGRWDDGSAAVTERAFGKGRVVVSGGNFAMKAFRDPATAGVPEVYRAALNAAGMEMRDSLLWRYSRYSDRYEYRFLFNAGEFAEVDASGAEVLYTSPGCVIKGVNLGIPLQGTAILRFTRRGRE